MNSSSPNILQYILNKAGTASKLSADAQDLLSNIKKEFDSEIFKQFFREYELLSAIGLTETDLKQYFNEWCTEAVAILNSNGIRLFVNDKHVKLFGYAPEEIIGKSGYSMLTEESVTVAKGKSDIRKKGVSDVYEVKVIKKDGTVIDVRVSGRPLFNSKNEYLGSIGIFKDVTKEKELEDRLRLTNEELEAKVQKRTRELTISNYQMVNEIKERKLAEIAVKNSEKRFRDLFYSSPEGIFVEDFDGNILDLNEAGANLHGYKRDELIGKNVKDFSPPEDTLNFDHRQTQLKIGEIKSFESKVLHRDGYLVPVAVRTAVIEYNDKPALLLHARDITDRVKYQETLKQMNQSLEEKVTRRTEQLENLNQTLQKEVTYRKEAEIAIEQQKDFLRLLIDMNPNLIFVKDGQGKFVLVNEAYARIYNTTPKEMIGRDLSAFLKDEKELEGYIKRDDYVLSEKKSIAISSLDLFNYNTSQPMHVQMIKTPIKSPTDSSLNVLGVITDITEIKRAEEKLKESEQLYRQIARNVPNSAIYIYDKDMRYVLAEGPLVGIISPDKDQVEGRTVQETVSDPVLQKERIERYQKILDGHQNVEIYEDESRTLLTNAIPIRDNDGNIIYGMVIILEITDLKKAEKELEEKASNLKRSNEELERFAYVASHDLQGPLRTITSYLQLLEQRYFADLGSDAKDFISFSVSGAKRMQQLITDLLNYSRLNSIPRPYQIVNLNELVFVVTKNLESTIQAKEAIIEYSDLPMIFGEQYQITQMLQNLIDNGMKFVKDRIPHIKVTCTEDADYWCIGVTDNGIGIKEEFKDKVFLIFQRLHTDNEYSGTGIGLAICKKVADLHNGKIWFESTYGEGTTFYVTISKHLKNKAGMA